MRVRKRIAACILVSSLAITLGGCGFLPKMTELTDEDQEQIALYCSRVISKFNIHQDRGLVSLIEDTSKSDKEEDQTQPAQTEEDTSESDDADGSDTGDSSSGDEDSGSDQSGDEDSGSEDSGDQSQTEDQSRDDETVTTLTEAIGVEGVTFLYKGAKVSTDYRSGEVYDLTPDEGNELLVMRIKAKNTTDKDITLTLPNLGLRFEAGYEGVTATSQATLLLNDLTTFDGTIRADRSKNLVILFQFPTGTVKKASDVTLALPRGNITYTIDTELSAKK